MKESTWRVEFYATASSALEQHQVYNIGIPLINTFIYTIITVHQQLMQLKIKVRNSINYLILRSQPLKMSG